MITKKKRIGIDVHADLKKDIEKSAKESGLSVSKYLVVLHDINKKNKINPIKILNGENDEK